MKTFLQITIFLFMFFLGCKENTTNDFPINFEGKVIAIKDGDTYNVLYNGKEQTIRLAHIDCPEKRQPFGSKAKEFASDLCFGKMVKVKTEGTTDQYNRLIGEIILPDGTNVNKELVKAGLAWHFKKYSGNTTYAKLEEEAKRRRIGLWADKEPIAPWEWRHKSKKTFVID